MKFDLKKFGKILIAVAPVVLLAVPGGEALAPYVGVIVTGIADAQAKPDMTNPEKRAYVQKQVENAAKATNLVRPGTIDTSTLVEAAGHGVDAVIGSIKAVAGAHAALPTVPSLLLESGTP